MGKKEGECEEGRMECGGREYGVEGRERVWGEGMGRVCEEGGMECKVKGRECGVER